MASLKTEFAFVAQFWNLAALDHQEASRLMVAVRPEMLAHEGLSAVYAALSDRYATGKTLEDPEVEARIRSAFRESEEWVSPEEFVRAWESLLRVAHSEAPVLGTGHAKEIVLAWRGRVQAQLLSDISQTTMSALERGDWTALRELGEKAAMRILTLHTDKSNSEPETREEMVAAELGVVDAGEEIGVPWPYPKMNFHLGPILPGRVYGITGYPGCGKTLLAVNMLRGIVRRGTPGLAAVTEMQAQWMRRFWAAESRVPQDIAEHLQWHKATPAQKAAYKAAVKRSKEWPWEVVTKPDLTVDDIIARFTVLRRRFPGKHVVGVVDHMHELAYPDDDDIRWVGEGTRRLRQFCMNDREGGFSLILLFQPRKPQDMELEIFRPVRYHQIAGRGKVGAVLDVHMSPYRRWVRTSEASHTSWGTPSTMKDLMGRPEVLKGEEQPCKVDDEHIYIKPDKRRVGGEGPDFFLNVHGPTGDIYESAGRDDPQQAGEPAEYAGMSQNEIDDAW